MNTIFSPNNIEVLLHCHCSAFRHPREDAPAVKEAIEELLKEGAITANHPQEIDRPYITTTKGAAWVQALCNVPPPRSVWVDEQGKILNPL